MNRDDHDARRKAAESNYRRQERIARERAREVHKRLIEAGYEHFKRMARGELVERREMEESVELAGLRVVIRAHPGMTPPTKPPTPGEAARKEAQRQDTPGTTHRRDWNAIAAAAVKAAREGGSTLPTEAEIQALDAWATAAYGVDRPDPTEAERAHCERVAAEARKPGQRFGIQELRDLLLRERAAAMAEGEIEIERWKDECKVLQQNNAVADVELSKAYELQASMRTELATARKDLAELRAAAESAHARPVYEIRGSGSVDSHDAGRILRAALTRTEIR